MPTPSVTAPACRNEPTTSSPDRLTRRSHTASSQLSSQKPDYSPSSKSFYGLRAQSSCGLNNEARGAKQWYYIWQERRFPRAAGQQTVICGGFCSGPDHWLHLGNAKQVVERHYRQTAKCVLSPASMLQSVVKLSLLRLCTRNQKTSETLAND